MRLVHKYPRRQQEVSDGENGPLYQQHLENNAGPLPEVILPVLQNLTAYFERIPGTKISPGFRLNS
jgi:hypothetical protein